MDSIFALLYLLLNVSLERLRCEAAFDLGSSKGILRFMLLVEEVGLGFGKGQHVRADLETGLDG